MFFQTILECIWERGCSLCPMNYNKPLPEDVCCCSHTHTHPSHTAHLKRQCPYSPL